MMRKRLAFQCWKCDKTYTLMKEITDGQELIIACPFCDAEAVVQIEPYKKKIIPVSKGGGDEQAVGVEYDFPDLIPTQRKPN